jgi:hypothetical protein
MGIISDWGMYSEGQEGGIGANWERFSAGGVARVGSLRSLCLVANVFDSAPKDGVTGSFSFKNTQFE